MILKKISFTLFIALFSTFLFAGSHEKTGVKEEFNKAIKLIEKMRYFEAFQIFSDLSQSDIPEAQYNLALLYSNGLGAPKNYKLSLYWSWQAHLNGHETAIDRITATYDLINENLRNEVAQLIIDELLITAKNGDRAAPLKLGKTYLGLFVEAQNQPAYLWLSIAQAYGDKTASDLLEKAATQLTLEEVLAQQEEAHKTFQSILEDN
jgi:TPR repeat protein